MLIYTYINVYHLFQKHSIASQFTRTSVSRSLSNFQILALKNNAETNSLAHTFKHLFNAESQVSS